VLYRVSRGGLVWGYVCVESSEVRWVSNVLCTDPSPGGLSGDDRNDKMV
jgi:hypothetical protein